MHEFSVDKPPPRSCRGKIITSTRIHISSSLHDNCKDLLPGWLLIQRRLCDELRFKRGVSESLGSPSLGSPSGRSRLFSQAHTLIFSVFSILLFWCYFTTKMYWQVIQKWLTTYFNLTHFYAQNYPNSSIYNIVLYECDIYEDECKIFAQ